MPLSSPSPRTATPVLEAALRHLARDIHSEDGVANAAIHEGAERLSELRALLSQCVPYVEASARAETLLDGVRRTKRPLEQLVQRLHEELACAGVTAQEER